MGINSPAVWRGRRLAAFAGKRKCDLLLMNTLLVWANFTPLTVTAGATILFLKRALPLRRERPELLQNALWFLLTFLLTRFAVLVWIILLPLSALVAIIATLKPSKKAKGPIVWAALGIWASVAMELTEICFLNTYFMH